MAPAGSVMGSQVMPGSGRCTAGSNDVSLSSDNGPLIKVAQLALPVTV